MKTIALILCLVASAAHAAPSARLMFPNGGGVAGFTNDGTTTTFPGGFCTMSNATGVLSCRGYVATVNDVTLSNNQAYYMNGNTHTAFMYYDGANVNIGTAAGGLVTTGDVTLNAGRFFARSATSGFSFGSAGSQFFGMAAGSNVVSLGASASLDLLASTSITVASHPLISSTAPTISGFTGTGAAVSSSNGASTFDINVGTVAPGNTGTINLPTANTGWECRCRNKTTTSSVNEIIVTSDTTATCVIAQVVIATGSAANFAASDHVRCMCLAL